jgi:hypothetical protein
MTTTTLLNSKLGVNGMFYILGAIQVASFMILWAFMKETRGLSAQQKKELYSLSAKKSV